MAANNNQPLDERIIQNFGSKAEAVYYEILFAEHEAKTYELRTEMTWVCYYCLGYCLQVAEYFLEDDIRHLPEDAQDQETLIAILTTIKEIIQRRRDMNGVR